MLSWMDMNGHVHTIQDNIQLEMQQPKCKYLLPCGICTFTSDLHTCDLLAGKKVEDKISS